MAVAILMGCTSNIPDEIRIQAFAVRTSGGAYALMLFNAGARDEVVDALHLLQDPPPSEGDAVAGSIFTSSIPGMLLPHGEMRSVYHFRDSDENRFALVDLSLKERPEVLTIRIVYEVTSEEIAKRR